MSRTSIATTHREATAQRSTRGVVIVRIVAIEDRVRTVAAVVVEVAVVAGGVLAAVVVDAVAMVVTVDTAAAAVVEAGSR